MTSHNYSYIFGHKKVRKKSEMTSRIFRALKKVRKKSEKKSEMTSRIFRALKKFRKKVKPLDFVLFATIFRRNRVYKW